MTIPGTLFLFAILFAIARTGFPIQCEVSHEGTLRGKRSTSLETCPPEFDACESLVIEASMSGRSVTTVKKSCSKRASCVPGPVLMHLSNGLKETGNNLCCTTNGCNSVVPPVPVWNETPNGLWCPSCSVNHPDPCQKKIMLCKGLENKCFLRIAGYIVQMGCATESFCANSAQTMMTITDDLHALMSHQDIRCISAPKI